MGNNCYSVKPRNNRKPQARVITSRDVAIYCAPLQVASHDNDVLAEHPEIGVLMRDGAPMYYVTAPAYAESRDPRDLLPHVR